MSASSQSRDDGGTNTSINRWKNWFLLDGDRGHVAGITAVVLFVVILVLGLTRLVPLDDLRPLSNTFSALVRGNITLVTVVVSINQLLLSRELNRPNELENQIEGVVDFREEVRDVAGELPPVEPAGFLQLLIDNAREAAQNLGGMARNEADDEIYDEISDIVTTITNHADRVDTLIEQSDASTFSVLSATLLRNYAIVIYRLKQVQAQYDLSEDLNECVDTLIQNLEDIDIARQYFKTIYLQEELASLSRILFYLGIPSIVVVIAGSLLLTGSAGATIPDQYYPVVFAAIVAVGLVPLSVLFAFILRIATVTQKTAARLPFTTPSQY